jgi:hypothetical protein
MELWKLVLTYVVPFSGLERHNQRGSCLWVAGALISVAYARFREWI